METNTLSDSSITSGDIQQGRRLACDRCRGQKLKCERSDIPDCCQRCTKAGAQCSFGHALPPGRPRIHTRRESATAKQAASTTRRTLATETAESPTYEHETPLTVSGFIDSIPLDDPGNIMNFLCDDDFAVSWGGVNHSQGIGLLVATSPVNTSNIAGRGLAKSALTPSLPSQSPPSTALVHSSEFPGDDAPSVSMSSLVALMQKVTELGTSMHTLHTNLSRNEHKKVDMNSTFPVELSGEVLRMTHHFLKLLRCFFLEDSSPFTPTSATSPESRREFMYPSDLDHLSRDRGFPHSIDPAGFIRADHPSRARQQRRVYTVDKPCVLQLIISYQRLLSLYRLFYEAVYDYVRCTEPSSRQSQPIWKDLNIGGAPLDQFADLHIKLVLQGAARMLEEIEATLGLPDGCRVSRKSNTDGDGILGTSVTLHFVEMCMADETTYSEPGRGVIAWIREMANGLVTILDTPGMR
ncbi:hypothetical protein GGS24DRAFT_447381 [Hypoxylon argillaceum]|nr:hypothetical protein GGS24DRAFT_447381 [Hypoxylon argillaceum]KAI1145527.1 hypothetical protein F4825DRAFT_443631 [Nemania diffusa]